LYFLHILEVYTIFGIIKENRETENSPHSIGPPIWPVATVLGAGSVSAAKPTVGTACGRGSRYTEYAHRAVTARSVATVARSARAHRRTRCLREGGASTVGAAASHLTRCRRWGLTRAPYQESNLSTSTSSDDDDEDSGDYQIEPSQPPIQFVGVKYRQIYLYSFHIIFLTSLTHALLISWESHYSHGTQDTDHGAPHSQRETVTAQNRHTSRGREKKRGRQHYLSSVDSSSSQNTDSSTYMPMDSTHTCPLILHN
jgi:hypothetical protein